MARKNVISDFSALKGKISFSEPCHDVQKPSQPEAEAMSKPKEEYLKTGQAVVLMDSDLRGKIVSIGRKVGNWRSNLTHSTKSSARTSHTEE